MLKLLVLLVAFCPQDDIIAPENAAEHIGEDVSVKMVAESTRIIKDKDLCFLNSKKDHQDSENFSVVIKAAGLAAFADKEITDPAEYFKGKTIIVKGRVVKFKGKPQIEIKSADQIEIVDEDSIDEPASSEPEEMDSNESDKDSDDGPIKPGKDDGGGR